MLVVGEGGGKRVQRCHLGQNRLGWMCMFTGTYSVRWKDQLGRLSGEANLVLDFGLPRVALGHI